MPSRSPVPSSASDGTICHGFVSTSSRPRPCATSTGDSDDGRSALLANTRMGFCATLSDPSIASNSSFATHSLSVSALSTTKMIACASR